MKKLRSLSVAMCMVVLCPNIAVQGAATGLLKAAVLGMLMLTRGSDGFVTLAAVDSTGNVGLHTSLQLNSADRAVISYYDGTNTRLKLAVCTNDACTTRTRTVVDTGSLGTYTSLQLASGDLPVISYHDSAAGSLKLVRCLDTTCSASVINIVDNTAAVVGLYTSLQLTSAGNPVIAYYDQSNGNLKIAFCGDSFCTSILIVRRNLVTSGNVGQYASLQLDSSDIPVVSYYDATNENLKIIKCGNAGCTSGNTNRNVDTTGRVGKYTSLQLNSLGYPVISYTKENDLDSFRSILKLARCNDPTCSSVTRVEVDKAPLGANRDAGDYSSLQLTGGDIPVISYYEAYFGSLWAVFCGDITCSGSNAFAALDTDGSNNVGLYTSLQLDSSGNLAISYYKGGAADNLKFARSSPLTRSPTKSPTRSPSRSPTRSPTDATVHPTDAPTMAPSAAPTFSPHNGQVTVVDSGGANEVGTHTSMQLNSAGNAVISYYDSTDSDLRVAVCDDLPCTTRTITQRSLAGTSGQYGALQLVSGSDYPLISYSSFSGSGSLNLYLCGNPTCTSGNTIKQISGPGGIFYSSLALDSNGYPVMTYYDLGDSDLILAVCSDPTCSGSITINTVDALGDVGQYNDLKLTASNLPVISYYDTSNSLKLALCGDALCNSVTIVNPDVAPAVGLHTSLQLNALDRAVVAYYDFGNGRLKLLRCGAGCTPGPDTAINVVDSTGDVGQYASLQLTSADLPVISYYRAGAADLKIAFCGNEKCTGGIKILTLDHVGNVGQYTSLQLSGSLDYMVAYYDATNKELKYIYGEVPTQAPTSAPSTSPSAAPTFPTVSPTPQPTFAPHNGQEVQIDSPNVGEYNSMQLNSMGYPVMSYYDRAGGQLKFARCTNVACSVIPIAIVASSGDEGRYTSLQLKSDDSPVISYFSPQLGGSLKVVICGNFACTAIANDKVLESVGMGEYTSLQLDSNEYPIISYMTLTGDLKLLLCQDALCNNPPNIYILDAGASTLQHTSMQLDSIGRPVIAYHELTTQKLKAYFCSIAQCNLLNNIIREIDASGNVGGYPSLRLNSNDYPVISYYDVTFTSLKVAVCTDTQCASTIHINTVDNAANVGQHTSLQLDSSEHPVITYYDLTGGNLKIAICGDPLCALSGSITIITLDHPGNVGKYTSLQLDGGDYMVSYYALQNSMGSLEYIYGVLPTSAPTISPTQATSEPSTSPTQATTAPSVSPTQATSIPSASPTQVTANPTFSPTQATSSPSASPTQATANPSVSPTQATSIPSASPTQVTANPTFSPTQATSSPSSSPTQATANPSVSPTQATSIPSASPTQATGSPTISPTQTTASPTTPPTSMPTVPPTKNPTNSPSTLPTAATTFPTNSPTNLPTGATTPPSNPPTNSPTGATTPPSNSPSKVPTAATTPPTASPTNSPTAATTPPTGSPTNPPTGAHDSSHSFANPSNF